VNARKHTKENRARVAAMSNDELLAYEREGHGDPLSEARYGQGVPVAVIAAWIGHNDDSLTMRLYAHSQDDALKAAGASLNRVVTRS
jgi:hypothetical protein